jgi:hypothetical protein
MRPPPPVCVYDRGSPLRCPVYGMRCGLRPPAPSRHMLVTVFAGTHPQVIKNALEPLNCVSGTNGRSVVFADPSIVCDVHADPQYR